MISFPHSTALQAQMREAARLEALRKLDLLDSAPSESFDRITRMAAHIFDLPIAAISLTDSERQWFKSRVGVDHDSIPRLRAPCSHVADEAGLLVVPDLLKDVFFRDSHLARSGVRFYAGAPLMTDDGFCLGAMCVLGVQPRSISAAETVALLDLAAMVMSQIELEHAMGRVDAHSGLPNRGQFLHDVKDVGAAQAPETARLAVLVNLASPQQLGHLLRVLGFTCLDAMTIEAARLLGAALGPKRRLYHVGPAQLVFFAPADGARQACRQWLQQWQDRHGNAAGCVTTACIGLAPFAATGGNAPDLLRNLHRAAEDALRAPDRVSLYSPAQDAAYRRRFTLFDEFGAALEMPAQASAQLRLLYQPRVELATGACTGVAALLRWEHPLLGAVPPAEFIPLMEQTALARALTSWVLEAAMRQLAAWRAAGVRRQLTVNVAAANLPEPDFAERVLRGLARHDLPPACLALEMSERAVMAHPTTAPATLAALAAAGVPLLIDAVGAGCGSLSCLQGLPVTMVKIDHSLMRELARDDERNARRRALVAAMIGLWRQLGYRVVAEGVETAAVAAFLRDAGCDEAQGALYAPPMPAPQLEAWLGQR